MSLTIACYSFERHHYDQRGDVLYLSVEGYKGPPARALSTPEGHNVEYDTSNRVVGMTLTNVRWPSIAMDRSRSPGPRDT